ncbi:putative transcriptional regulator [Microbacterium testaceum]|uniref:helix-turn-helix domain-containing protein n=1 Tax=Microbacterium testaceum TaxID=2033 RepID=UPI002786CDF5|nr:helix-turn-helix transcriptional regulator [Microbacterium testaceum]MDQ1174212.1 putative transcriptional regulator [Microbacterium testaceum]
MNRTNEQAATQPPTIRVRPGLLKRLKDSAGIRNDEAFARLIGISRATLTSINEGNEPSLRSVVNIANAFGLAVGEVIIVTDADEAAEHTPAAIPVAS